MFDLEARKKVRAGIDILANTVKVTMGPKGRNVVIGKTNAKPNITKDGVSVAKEVTIVDPVEHAGAEVVKSIALKVEQEVGDGTTTAIVLAQRMYEGGMKKITSGTKPSELIKGMQAATKLIINYLQSKARAVENEENIRRIATVSANGDIAIGNLLTEAFQTAEDNQSVLIEEGQSVESSVRVEEGFTISRGFLSEHFITNAIHRTVEFEHPFIVVTDSKVTSIQDMVPALEISVQQNRPLLLVVNDIDQVALSALVLNNERANLRVAVIKSPGFGSEAPDILEDFAVYTGATLISQDRGQSISNIKVEDLGSADKIVIDDQSTLVVNGKGHQDEIQERKQLIRRSLREASSDFEKDKLLRRQSVLSGKVITIQIGAKTETALAEKRDRVEDAFYATKAAIAEGYLPGGGLALFRAKPMLHALNRLPDDQKIGVKVVGEALEAPLRTIAENAGVSGSVIVGKLTLQADHMGFNAATGQIEPLEEAGIIDPLKTVRITLESAVSATTTLLNSECIIVEEMDADGKIGSIDY